MYRSALRSSPRVANALRQTTPVASGCRFASTTPASKKRGWKSWTARWGLAAGALYLYSTSAVFAEEPSPKTIPPPPQFSDNDLPTVEAVVAQKRREAEERVKRASLASEPPTATSSSETSSSAPVKDVDTVASPLIPEGSPESLEEEANQQGAFNPETGEINWDCPCLGGMAHGPCGEEFKAAFSCFVYSNEEPKGMDCIDRFQHMQDCFRLHPEVYGDELADDEVSAEGSPDSATDGAIAARETSPESSVASRPEPTAIPAEYPTSANADATEDAKETKSQKQKQKQNQSST